VHFLGTCVKSTAAQRQIATNLVTKHVFKPKVRSSSLDTSIQKVHKPRSQSSLQVNFGNIYQVRNLNARRLPRRHALALAAGLPRHDHVHITTDESSRFHKNKFDEMLDSTENPRSFKKYTVAQPHLKYWCMKHRVGCNSNFFPRYLWGLFFCMGAKEKNKRNVGYGRGCVHAYWQPAPLRTKFEGGEDRVGVGAEAMILDLMPKGKSIFGPLSRRFFLQRVFTEQISSSTSLDIQLTLLCVRRVDLFIPYFPEFKHLMEKLFCGLFSKKKAPGGYEI